MAGPEAGRPARSGLGRPVLLSPSRESLAEEYLPLGAPRTGDTAGHTCEPRGCSTTPAAPSEWASALVPGATFPAT